MQRHDAEAFLVGIGRWVGRSLGTMAGCGPESEPNVKPQYTLALATPYRNFNAFRPSDPPTSLSRLPSFLSRALT